MTKLLPIAMRTVLVLSCAAIAYEAAAQGLDTHPTPTTDLSVKRDAYDDAYSAWNKLDINLDTLRKLKPADAMKRLDDAQKASQRLQKARQQYHAALRTEYQRLKANLEDNSGPSAESVSQTTKLYDTALSLLADDASSIDAQIPVSATDGASIVYQQGLKQAKEKISTLQLTLIQQKTMAQRTATTAKDAVEARKALAPHLDALLKNLDTYDQLDTGIGKDMDNLVDAYRGALTELATSRVSIERPTLPPAGDQGKRSSDADRGAGGAVKPVEPPPPAPGELDLKAIAGEWFCDPKQPYQGSVKPKTCDVTIRADGGGNFSADFAGLKEPLVVFSFRVSRYAGSQFEGQWNKGTANGTVTIQNSGTDLLFEFNTKDRGENFQLNFYRGLRLTAQAK